VNPPTAYQEVAPLIFLPKRNNPRSEKSAIRYIILENL